MNYLGLDDIVMIAAAVLGIEPEVLRRTSRIDGDETVEMMLAAAAETVDEAGFVAWVGTRVYSPAVSARSRG